MTARRPRRPIVAAALALAAGSAWTAPGERDGAWSVAAVAGAGALCAARSLPPATAVALLALAPAGALRAAAGALPAARAVSSPTLVERGAPAPFTGALRRATGTTEFGDERWRLAGDGLALELPPGLVREGELALVSPAARGLRPATGPFTDARSRRPIVLLPQSDEVVRLAPAPRGRGAGHGPCHGAPASPLERVAASAGSPSSALPTSFFARVSRELEAVRSRGIERIADAGRAAPDDDEDTFELDAEPLGAAPITAESPSVQLPHAGLLAALLLGASDDVDFEVGEHFTRTGTRHILSLSGLHFGLVAWLLGRPLAHWVHAVLWGIGAAVSGIVARLAALAGRMPRAHGAVCRRLVSVTRTLTSPSALLAAGALAFVPLAGSSPPAARAAVALALASLADLVGKGATQGRRPDALTLWSTALLLEVLARPAAPLAVSVQLSYGATLALIVAYRPTLVLLRGCVPGGGRLAPVDGSGRRRSALGRVPLERLLDAVLGALSAGLVATIATLPITWARFGEWSPMGIVATALVTPFVTGALVGGYAWLLAPEAAPLSLPAWSLELIVRTLAWCDTLPATPIVLPFASTDRLVLSASAALAALVFAGQRPGLAPRAAGRTVGHAGADDGGNQRVPPARRLALVAAAVALLAPMRRSADPPRDLELVACDVGRGRALLLRAPGLGIWLIDGGSSDRAGVARRALLPALRAWGAREIGVVLTSDSRALGSALPWLVERFDVHTWVGAPPEAVGVAEARARSGPRLDVDDGAVEVRLADPRSGLTLVRARGAARALVVRAGHHTVWVLGEASDSALDELLVRGYLTAHDQDLSTPREDPARGQGERLLVWPTGEVGRASGALLDALAPRLVWLAPPVPADVQEELSRRGVPSAAIATSGGCALGLTRPPGAPSPAARAGPARPDVSRR